MIPINYNLQNNYNIKINPVSFGPHSNINKINNDWFVNISNQPIPKNVQLLVQLGDRFNLPVFNKDKRSAAVDIIKNVESSLFNVKKSAYC